MPTFDFPSVLWWGLPVAAAPLLIHLINLLRHRTVDWSAMEFLLASQRKYRTRVLLKQLLLMAMRVAAIAGIALALAQPRWRSALAGFLGGEQTTHILLIDDSYSMSEETLEETCFDRSREVARRLLDEFAAAGSGQSLGVGRFSRLSEQRGAGFDLLPQSLTPEILAEAEQLVDESQPSQSAAGPREAIAAAAEFATSGETANTVLWVLSDFRNRDWQAADETASLLRQVADAGGEIRFVDCSPRSEAATQGNLAVESIRLVGGVPAAGVVLPMDVTVRNHAAMPTAEFQLDLREDGVARPGLRFDPIPAGAAASQRVDVRFPESGEHALEASLGPDRVAADNTRAAVVSVAEAREVLLIDGATVPGERGGDAFYVASALAPGGGAPTGLSVRIDSQRVLASEDLSRFDTVWLLDVASLDTPEIEALEAYARAGGGVGFFVGPRTLIDSTNDRLYRDGEGLFPVPLAGDVDLLPDAAAARGGDRVADVVVEYHPTVAVLSGRRNPLVASVRVERVMAVDRSFEPAEGSGLRRLLSLRTGAPLLLEQPFGDGLVAVALTTAAPTWNNWARGNPSWVVVMLELESSLARGRRSARSSTVGEPIRITLQEGLDEPQVDFVVPPDDSVIHREAQRDAAGGLVAELTETGVAGLYTSRWRQQDGVEQTRLMAINVDPAEGELETVGRDQLDRLLVGVPFTMERAESLQEDRESLAGTSLATPLLYLLVVLLLLEQLVSYSASYHPVSRKR
ncbi:MAG: BatA domain-containing protein [Pirellulales bacterium]|nr:BatA domain-containing protein [Pirellulales bacterium]